MLFILKKSAERFAILKESRTFALELRKQHRGVEQLVARWAHNPKVVCSSQASATTRETLYNASLFLSLPIYPKKGIAPFYLLSYFCAHRTLKIRLWQISKDI